MKLKYSMEDQALDAVIQELFEELYDGAAEPRLKSTPHPRDFTNAFWFAEALDDQIVRKRKIMLKTRQTRSILLDHDGCNLDWRSINLFCNWHGCVDTQVPA